MTNSTKRHLKKRFVPLGIFMMLFIIESLLSVAGIGFYQIQSTAGEIKAIEEYTRDYSITLAEAFSELASQSYRSRKYAGLKSLFRKKIQENIIDEAFFVLSNGDIIAHSNKEIEKELRGNIANDEFAYNIDLILRPVEMKNQDVQFTHYNIMGKRLPDYPVPFGTKREHRALLKEYVYPAIDSTGWLFSKAVFVKGRPVGTVNFIVSKKRIFDCITAQIEDTFRLFIIALGVVFGISLLISIVVFIRYKKIQKETGSGFAEEEDRLLAKINRELAGKDIDLDDFLREENITEQDVPVEPEVFSGMIRAEDLETEKQDESERITVEVLGEIDEDIRDGRSIREHETCFSPGLEVDIAALSKPIRDAIPVIKKR